MTPNDKLTPLPPRATVERAERNQMANKHDAESGAAVAGAAPCSAITLTCAEIVDLVKFCGLRLMEEPDDEEKQTEITIQTWPEKGVMDDDGVTKLPPHKYIAYYEDLPEEGCVPLGSPNAAMSDCAGGKLKS